MKIFTKKTRLLLLLMVFLCTNLSIALANVIITQPTGGQNISNDLSSVGTAPAFSALGNIVIADQVAGDFAVAAGSRTIILSRPSTSWQFQSGVGSVGFTGPNIQSASVAVTASTITVTYTITGTAATGNSITISGIQVQSTIRTLGVAANITRTGGTAGIAGFTTGAVVASLSKKAGAAVSLQVLLPGQSNVPGNAPGKTGTITQHIAGANFSVVVNAVDYAFNVVTDAPNHSVSLSSSNAHPILPAAANLSSGTVTFNVALKTVATASTITATDITDGSIAANSSSSVRINVGTYNKLLVLLPGEMLDPGSATGKSGTPANRISNVATPNVTVYAVDAFWNRLTSGVPTNAIKLSTNDPLGVNPANRNMATNGTVAFSIRLLTIGQLYHIKAENVSDPTKTDYTSALVNVVAGPFTKLQILLPGESSVPNTTSGKTGTPFFGSPPVAGSSFNVTVNAVDANWNVISTVTDIVGISNVTAAYSASSTIEANKPLSGGTASFSVTLNRAATNHQLRATDISDGTKTAITSTTFTVAAGAFSKLQILLPGETADPGTPTGKTGVPTDRSAGAQFAVTVNAVDAFWNRVSVTPTIAISTANTNPTLPANAALVAGTRAFNITLRTMGIATVNAADVSMGVPAVVSSNVNVISGGFTRLQILLPGETAAPGTVTGKTGSPIAQVAGTPFIATVNAVDAAWNVVNTVTDVVSLTSTDLNATMPANAALVAGTRTFSVTLITGGSRTITANDVTDGSKTLNTSAAVTIGAGAYARILALLPSQNNAPGTLTGITGNPVIPANGVAFTMRVRAVDQYFNPVNGITNSMSFIKSSALDAVTPSPTTFVTNNFRNITTTINTPGPQTITVTDGVTAFSVVVNIPAPTSVSAQTDHFRSFVSGVWGDATTWESSTDGVTNWHAATLFPNSTSNTITILNGHVVEVLANVSVDQVTIATGGELVVNLGTLTVANGADAVDMQVNGTLTGENTGVITSTGATFFASGSKYQHKYTTISGTIPTATWNTGSICEISGYTSYVNTITGSGQNFATLNWNCPSQNNATDGPALGASFNAQQLNVISTGTGMFFLGGAAGTSTISGNFTLTDGKVALTRAGTKTLNVAGNFILVGGRLERGNAAANINFSGVSTQQFANITTTISGAINFAINNGATVDFGTAVLNGTSGTFTVNTGGTLVTANADGIAATGTNTGTIQNTSTRTYGAANYTYNGSVVQLAGSGLPATLNNLTVANAQGVSLPTGTSTYTVNGVLTVNPSNGFLDLGEHPLAGPFTTAGAGRLQAQAISAFPTGKTWNVGVEYNSGATQNIISGTYNGLLATSGAGTKVGPSGALNVAGNWSSAGGEVDFASNSTPLTFSGSSAQSIADQGSNGGQGLEFQDVTFNGGGTKSFTAGNFTLAATATLTLGSNTTLAAAGRLTLLSTSSSSATIAAIPGTSAITGNVNVQRFITGGTQDPYRTYRMLSSPIHTGSGSYTFAQFIDDMIVTGPGGTGNGFDATGGSSAFTYSGSFVGISNINTSLEAGKGAYIFFRGDRSNLSGKTTSPFVNPENVVMDFEGVLNQQDVSVNLVSGGNLVGNPYASSINWNSTGINKSALVNNIIRIWNPASRAYATYDGAIGVGGGSNVIPSGQAFFVQTGGAGSLTFSESAKIAAQAAPLLMSSPINEPLTLNKLAVANNSFSVAATPFTELRVVLGDGNAMYSEETAVVFQSGKSAAYSVTEDANYIHNYSANGDGQKVFLSSLSADNRNLVINYMPEVTNGTNVKLNLNPLNQAGNYHLKVSYKDVPSGYIIKLNDSYLGTSTMVQNGDMYAFAIDKNVAASFGTNRLSVSFEMPTTLPVTYASFNVDKVNQGVSIKWSTATETNNNRFEIERAGDDGVFVKLHTEVAKGSAASYSYLDKTPLIGNNYYRLVQVDHSGVKTPNQPKLINYTSSVDANDPISIFPNPVVSQFTIKFNGELKANNQTLKVVSAAGQVLLTKTVPKSELNDGHLIDISNFAAGVYVVEILENGTQKIGQIKLIKQ